MPRPLAPTPSTDGGRSGGVCRQHYDVRRVRDGCVQRWRPTVIVLRDDANGKTMFTKAGDRIELILSSSYWQVTGDSAPTVLRQDGPPVPLPKPTSCPDVPGLGCTPVRANFSALTNGKAVITAKRSACGEALWCKPDQTRFTVNVVIRN